MYGNSGYMASGMVALSAHGTATPKPWYGFIQVFCFAALVPCIATKFCQISEITPRGKEYLFFSLFNIIGKASSFIGPLISSVMIDTAPSHNPSLPFYFLAALSVLSLGIIVFFVDLKRSQREQDRFLEEERLEKLAMAEGLRQKTRRL